MINPTVSTHVTLDLLAWHEGGSLELSPKFQRRPVWKAAAKSYFLDTMLRGYPIPPIHVRLGLGAQGQAQREIIDGQQRLRAVFDFVNGKYRLSRSLNEPWAGKSFNELPQEHKDQIMMFKFHGFQYENLSDATVLEIFARINTYSVALSKQELRNGKYFGVFKTAMYGTALQHLEFWRRTGIFSETSIARMQEVELTSELAILLLDGLQDKKASIDSFYRHLDEAWGVEPISWVAKRESHPRSYLSGPKITDQIEEVIDVISSNFSDILVSSEFSRPPLFYSFFGAIAHRMYGLPMVTLNTPQKHLTNKTVEDLREVLTGLSELLSDKPSLDDLQGWQRDFVLASSRQTDNIGPRRIRLETIWTRAGLGE